MKVSQNRKVAVITCGAQLLQVSNLRTYSLIDQVKKFTMKNNVIFTHFYHQNFQIKYKLTIIQY